MAEALPTSAGDAASLPVRAPGAVVVSSELFDALEPQLIKGAVPRTEHWVTSSAGARGSPLEPGH